MTIIISFIFIFLVLAFIWQAIRAKELACQHGKRHCQQLGVQFLDETVVQTKVRFKKDSRGNPVWSRQYQFEFATDGRHRYEGIIEMSGYQLQQITLEAYAIEDPGFTTNKSQFK